MPISKSTLTGSAGVHWVMHQLLRRGLIAALAPEGVPNIDLIVSDIDGEKVAALQVKTRNKIGSDNGWHMKPKHQELRAKNLYYCFVELDDEVASAPVTFVVPSKAVVSALTETHELWLSLPGKDGKVHKDSDVRRLLPDYSKTLKVGHPIVKKYSSGWLNVYKEAWSSLDRQLAS